jgi:glycosyltransferase 2 family protein
MKKLLQKLLLGLALGIGVYACVAIWVGVDQLAQSLASFHYMLFLPVLGLTFSNYLLRYLKWTLYLRLIGIQVPAGLNLVVFLSGLSMTVTPGKIGELLKAYLLREACGVPMARTAPVVMAERVTDLIALVLLMLTGFFTFRRFPEVLIIVASMVVLFLVVVSSRRLSLLLLRLLIRLPGLSRLGHQLEAFYESTALLFRLWPLLLATLLSVMAWFCECLGFYLVLSGFPHTAPSLLLAIFIYSATTLGGVATPGGLGITDASMTAFLRHAAAFPVAVAGAATLLIRLCTLWFAVIVGVVALFLFRRKIGLAEDVAQKLKSGAAGKGEIARESRP